MRLVVDANIVFAVLITRGKTAELFFGNNFDSYAPSFIFDEVDKHKELIFEKTHRTKEEFLEVKQRVAKKLTLISQEMTWHNLDQAEEISPDPDDIPYFALALELGCAIWSNDHRLKEQQVVKVWSSKELLEFFPTQ